MICSELFAPVPDYGPVYEWSRILFVPTHIVLAYYSNPITSCPAPGLIFPIAISEFFVCALVSFLLLGHVGGSAGFSSNFTGVEDIAK